MTSLLFNPSRVSTEELESTFVGRHAVLERLARDMVKDQEVGTPRHWQLIGPRGSGKSHLSELLARRMRLNYGWRIARLPEENYQAATLGELLEQMVVRSEGVSRTALADVADEIELQDRAVDLLRQHLSASKKPLLVILENLSAIFERQLRSTRDQARFRDILTNNPPFVLLATSTSQSEATVKHSAPFYDFFQTIVLDDLSRSDITELVKARAGWDQNTSLLADFEKIKGRIEAIYHLSGGNPRLALALYRVVDSGVTTELHEQIMKLLDGVTPYYQARLNDIPPQAARVLTEMAISDTVVTPAEVAKRSRMPTNQVTAHIKKLVDERLIIQGGRPNARSRYYELKDRLLRIWIQMRESTGAAKRLRFLAEFFERWYAERADELEELSRRTVSDFWSSLASGDDRRCVDRLKTISYLADMRPGFDGSVVMQVLSKQVHESSEPDIRAHVQALQRSFDDSSDSKERETLAFLLARCYEQLDVEEDARRFLKTVLDEGSQSQVIADLHTSALIAGGAWEEAWTFGVGWLREHPDHGYTAGTLGTAACGVGEYDAGVELLQLFIKREVCDHCVERALSRAIRVIRSRKPGEEIELQFGRKLLSGHEPMADAQILASHDILAAKTPSKVSLRAYEEAANGWKPLSKAPNWLLAKAICGLGHRGATELHSFKFISALAEKKSGPLSMFAVGHLLEILPRLRHVRNQSKHLAADYATAISLIRQRVESDRLGKAFRYMAPFVAKRYPDVAGQLIELYKEWREANLLKESITPYAETILVLSADEPDKVLQSMQAETRDAVSLLIAAIRAGKPSNRKTKVPAHSH